ncbi:M56 family metallopeptidase [Cohnella terricola]|uniref:Peptidoglycan DD-metalloendopeptidase family protein n=1 Tax=Cohnella terricola TaxID=1289167 RepID=A0A559JMV5_9BACL|nr:M23/M56 family metallopeptidase [Cohnella terricola]TVY01209.1 peptidoglycan DD-metalloendopeptidase family protein [Cohnella terricola]
MELIVRLFSDTLVTSLEVAALVVLIAALTRFLGKRLSPAWQYAIWILLLAKIALPLLPGDLDGHLRWIPLPDKIENRMTAGYGGGFLKDGAFISATDDGMISSPSAAGIAGNDSPLPKVDGWRLQDNALKIIAMAWLSGMVVVWLVLLSGHARMVLALRREAELPVPGEIADLFARIREDKGIRSGISLRLTRHASAPALFGMMSPVVLIPQNLLGQLNAAEWECILRHELAHLQRRDIPVNLAAYLLASVHWFNPAVWYGLRRMRIAQETACDANVLRTTGAELKMTYAASIVKLLEIGVPRKAAPVGVGFYGNMKQLKRRMVMIRDYRPAGKRASFVGITILILTAVLMLPSAFAATPAEKQSENSPVELKLAMPTGSKISSRYGYRIHPVTSEKTLNDGIDITGKKGSGITAAAGGKVVHAGYDRTKGNTVTIEHNEIWSTEYRHLDKLSVKEGDEVKAGDAIGLLGSTGGSTGPKLHYSVIKNGEYIDPVPVTTIALGDKK